MKFKTRLSLSIVLSLFTAQALTAADAKKKGGAPAGAPVPESVSAALGGGAARPEIKDPVAVVDGEEIKLADLDQMLAQVLAQQGQPPTAVPEDQRLGVYRMLLENLIAERLVNKNSAGIKVSDEQVDAIYQQSVGGIPAEELKEQMAKLGQTEKKFKEEIRTNIRQREWMDKQVQGKDEVSDADVEKFYKENLERFKQPEQVRASHILVKVGADATPEVVVEKQKAAKALYDRAKKGEDFAALAKEFSEDPSAKQNSGDLDFFTKEQMVPEFSDVAFALKKDELSEPVRSQFGYHIIKAVDRKAAQTQPLEETKPRLVAFLKNQKKQEAFRVVVEGLRAKAKVKINLPEAPAQPGAAPAGAK